MSGRAAGALLLCWNGQRDVPLCCRETLERGLQFCRQKQRPDGSWEG